MVPETMAPPRKQRVFVVACKGRTTEIVCKNKLGACPRNMSDEVQAIQIGDRVLVWEIDAHLVHGPYEACSQPGSNLCKDVEDAFNNRYPAQVLSKGVCSGV